MKEFYLTVDASRKNYLIISPEHGGRVHVEHDCKTDDELGEMADYSDFLAVSSLEVGAQKKRRGGVYLAGLKCQTRKQQKP